MLAVILDEVESKALSTPQVGGSRIGRQFFFFVIGS